MKTILCPTDFSKNALTAIEYGAQIAERIGAKLLLFHAYHLPIPPSGIVFDNGASMEDDFKEGLENLKHDLLSKHVGEGLEIETVAKNGLAVDEIINLAEEIRPEMIVMGTKGASGLQKIFLGTNTARIIESAKVPVLAVPENAIFNGISEIVMACDWLDDDEVVMQQLVSIAGFFNARIHILHILEPDEEFTLDQIEQMKAVYPEILKYENITMHVEKSDDAEEGIAQFLHKTQADMLAMLTRKRNLLDKILIPSLTKRMAYHSDVPMLVFHE